jgi:phosphatidylinositol alpha-1,6-mannosyltransferase
MSRPVLAAITLDSRGGGVATVSRLLWRVLSEGWPGAARLVTLVNAHAPSIDSHAGQRVVFGARLASMQAASGVSWILFSHVAIAKAQAFVPRPIRRPYAIFLHGIEMWRPLDALETRVLRGASALLVNSRYTSARIRSLHPWIAEPVVCPLAVDAPPDAPGTPQQPWGPKAVVVVGRMSPSERYKGHDELLEVWPDVLAREPQAKLVFVGGGGDVERLQGKARTIGVDGALVTTGFVDDAGLEQAYRGAAAFAMPSRNEGFGLVYLEAMVRGLPCIGSRDAAAEIIEDGRTGFIVDQNDRAALADRIVCLLKDPAAARDMGACGRARALDCFGYPQFRSRVLSALHAAFEPARAGAAAVRPVD